MTHRHDPAPVAPLVNQPSAAPTRKLTYAAVAELATLAAGAAVLFLGDLDISEAEVAGFGSGLAAVVIFVGKVVGYFTKDRSNR